MRRVTVVYHCEAGSWWAESTTPGLETFVAGAETLDETRRLAREGAALYIGDKVRLTEYFDVQNVVTHFKVEPSAAQVTVSGGPPRPVKTPKVVLTPAQPCALVS